MSELLDWTDSLPPDVRKCVHDFGAAPVKAMWDAGIRQARHMRHILFTCHTSSSEPGNRRGRGNGVLSLIDDILITHGQAAIARELVAMLRHSQLTIIPITPSEQMVEASMSAHLGAGVLNKTAKHRLRLRAALRQADESLWGPR